MKTHVDIPVKRIIWAILLAGLAALPIFAQGDQLKTSDLTLSQDLQAFDAAVKPARTEMRHFCGLVQQLMKAGPDKSAKQQEAILYIQKAASLWKQVLGAYQDNPPAAYAGDTRFPARLSEIQAGLAEIKKQLTAGAYQKSFRECALTCGLFVKMHEENSLRYAVDQLYHLRKTAKTLIAAGNHHSPQALTDQLIKLLFLRDQVVMTPCYYPEDKLRCLEYHQSIKALSSQIDDLTVAIVKKDPLETKRILNQLMPLINNAYGMAL